MNALTRKRRNEAQHRRGDGGSDDDRADTEGDSGRRRTGNHCLFAHGDEQQREADWSDRSENVYENVSDRRSNDGV
ncbi:hypothetical protein [Natrinema sp. SYSU A 869]|uniref:hypothetical protein n=1 Tax=Natrinema sp. SYSU A 869 TaxID=2871694 RepID=UPI001CA41CB4|nr:hypothetical protein [Natrinema sp. SYSU A 869]